ncbi:hypothetical protein QUC31_012312 [Theobroma cacao]
MRVAKAILETVTGVASSFSELSTVLEKIHESIVGKRFLLVLDDVWTEDERKWQSLKYCLNSGSQGSKILVTTRKENVATIMGCTKLFQLGQLSKEECWSLFSHIAFFGRNERERESLEDIGKKIADKCQGLPLAAKTLGGLLRFKRSREQWQRILDSHMWELDEAEKVASNGIEEQRADCYHENARHLTVILDDEHVAIPNPIYNLKKLRTLRVDSSLLCSSLIELPIGFERLVNLRHLQNAGTYGCNSMPPGMQRLTCLQTLEEFVVSSFRGWSIKGRSNISDLGSLAHLRGNLKIIGLGNVRTENEAEDAGLRNKTGLRNLTLSFNSNSKTTRITDEASVLEALQPPPYLESLNINRMNGPTIFPTWMASLSMLKRVIPWACFNWKTLPSMGKLPFLEHLEMWEMKKVNKVGEEFMGVEREEGQTSSSSSSSNNNNIAFPNLKHLKFQFMEEWEEWEFGNPSASIAHDGSSSITIMPCLHSLNIISCLKLKSLPRHLLQKTTLQSLEIFDCPILRERCLRNGTGEDWLYISHIPTITINGEDVQRYAH